MNNNIGAGAGILVLGELRKIENDASYEISKGINETNQARRERDATIAEKDQLTFAAKSQVHGFRARMTAKTLAEDDLIAALKSENPSHPLASREVVDLLVEKNYEKAMYDSTVAKKTYPDGIVPEGSIPIVNGKPGVVGGQPAYPDPTPEERLANQERYAMMQAAGLDGYTILDPARVTLAIAARHAAVAAIEQRLAEDSNKGFFGRMKKSDRAEVEADFERAKRHVVLLRDALVKAEEHASRQEKERLG
jgi:hypothetical protein